MTESDAGLVEGAIAFGQTGPAESVYCGPAEPITPEEILHARALEAGVDLTENPIRYSSDSSAVDGVFRETNSSGYSDDALNDREARLAADPGLEPELARQRQVEALERLDRRSSDLENTALGRPE